MNELFVIFFAADVVVVLCLLAVDLFLSLIVDRHVLLPVGQYLLDSTVAVQVLGRCKVTCLGHTFLSDLVSQADKALAELVRLFRVFFSAR